MTPIPSGSTGVSGLKDTREPPFRGTAHRTAVHSVGRTARADLAAPARADLAAVNVLKTRAPGGPGAPSRTEGPQGSPRQTLVDVWDHVNGRRVWRDPGSRSRAARAAPPVGARDRGLTRVREIVGQASRSSGNPRDRTSSRRSRGLPGDLAESRRQHLRVIMPMPASRPPSPTRRAP